MGVLLMRSLLIANRGEIACRIIKTARRMGLRTIAVYSDADARARHVRLADQAFHIGAGPARESYLKIEAIIEAAKATGADAIHPGYGFLSENADFVTACDAAGIIFVGPPASAMGAMGRKDAAKELMLTSNVPVVPGYQGDDQSAERLLLEAERIGYPVAIKAVAGGGGRGLRRVGEPSAFLEALLSAQREAAGAFGDARVLLEKWIDRPRHIEVQILADRHGHVVHLFERDCTMQRRHQKVVEEAPAPGMPADMREAMGQAAVLAARACGYVGAGTVEFIVDSANGLRADGFYFMEMNTRLQVEHPVTEMITGLDLVELQLHVAQGEPLPFSQKDLSFKGHAIEVRLCAEDPAHGFRPGTGQIVQLDLPQHLENVRFDMGFETGDVVSPFYDSMLGKIIAYGETREVARSRLVESLSSLKFLGLKSNTAFLQTILAEPAFVDATFDTGFLDREINRLTDGGGEARPQAVARGLAALLEMEGKREGVATSWGVLDGFEMMPSRGFPLYYQVDGNDASGRAEWACGFLHVLIQDQKWPLNTVCMPVLVHEQTAYVWDLGQSWTVRRTVHGQGADGARMGDGEVRAPIPGRVAAVLVEVGDKVEAGQGVAVLEAMKMEHALKAPISGVVSDVMMVGVQVVEGLVIVKIEPEASADSAKA
jgi:3-methylcrotonyl-CoA carboxylase alpha subunit